MGRGFVISAVLGSLLLSGCAKSGDDMQIVVEKVKVADTSCERLEEGMQNAYIIVFAAEEKVKELQNKKRTEAEEKKFKDQKEVIKILIPNFRTLEKEYNSRCPLPSPKMAHVRKEYPTKLLTP